jgi:hypothetical protein
LRYKRNTTKVSICTLNVPKCYITILIETLPATSCVYSSLLLTKTKQKTPLIDKLMAEEYQYIATKDVGNSFKWVDFVSMEPHFSQPLLGCQGQLLIQRSASLWFMQEYCWTTAAWRLVPTFLSLFKQSL